MKANKFRLNKKLLSIFFEVLNIPQIATLKSIGISNSTWRGWISKELSGNEKEMKTGGIPILTLVNLCNSISVPIISLFVKEGEADFIPPSEDLVYLRSQFIPCRFDIESFKEGFGIHSDAKMPVTSMLDKLDVSYTVYVGWITDAKNLRVQSFLDFCNKFGYELTRFIVDENFKEKPKENIVFQLDEIKKKDEITEVLYQNKQILDELKNLQKDLTKDEENRRIKEENERLRIENLELTYEIRRLKDRLQILENGNI